MLHVRCLLGMLVILALSACNATTRDDEEPQRVPLCADFDLPVPFFPDDYTFPDQFTYSAFKFKKLGGAVPWIVNAEGTGKGLRFPKEGLEVTLPAAVQVVGLKLGTFAGTVKIEAIDARGTVIHRQIAPHTNNFQPIAVTPAAGKIASLRFTEGGNEGNLSSICVELILAR